MDDTLDPLLLARAAKNGGYFTRADAADCGYRSDAIREAVRTGEFAYVRHGTFAPGEAYRALDAAGQHCVRGRAVADKLGDRVARSHTTACAEYDFALVDFDLSNVHVTRLDGGSGRTEAGVVHHEPTTDLRACLERVDGRLTVNRARAVWEASTLPGHGWRVALMDSALHSKTVDDERLAEAGRVFRYWPGARRARIAHALSDGDAESPGESGTRVLCWRFGVPKPTLQFEVINSSGEVIARTDFAWLEARHLGEFDGLVKYGRLRREGESASAAVVREKRREDLVRAEVFGMSRVIWPDILHRNALTTAKQLFHDLEQSRRLYTRNQVVIAL